MPKGIYPRSDPKKTLIAFGDSAWLKQDCDTDTSYSRFVVYRDMGPERSLQKVVNKLGKKPGYLKQLTAWSSAHRWVARVEAYDGHLDEQRLAVEQKERLKAAAKSARESVMIADSFQKLVAKELLRYHRKLDRALENGEDLDTILSPADLQKLFDVSVRVRRLENNEPDSITEARHELTVDERRERLRALMQDPETRRALETIAKSHALPAKTGT